MARYKVNAWIYPIGGRFDYPMELEAVAKNIKAARKVVEKWLSKRSAVINDYQLVRIKRRGYVNS